MTTFIGSGIPQNFSLKPAAGEKIKVTIYTTSEMMGHVVAREGTLVECGRRKYAQYDSAPFVTYIPKGCRKPEGFVKGYRPYLLVVKGWGRVKPGELYGKSISNDGVVEVRQSTHKSFDDGWIRDFEAVLAGALSRGELKAEDIIFDGRAKPDSLTIPDIVDDQ